MPQAVISFIWILALLFYTSPAVAQAPTFGPLCDGVTVTCPPTTSPTISPTPAATVTVVPTQTPPPPELPRAGMIEPLLTIAGLGGILLVCGTLGRLSLRRSHS